MPRPTREELLAAAGRTVPDVIAPGLRVLFCGINPGLHTAVVGHHFARPGNRFWRALYEAGFTDRLLAPPEKHRLLGYGCGITNLAVRATASAAELSEAELVEGGRQLEGKVRRYVPRYVAVLGISVYRAAFGYPQARVDLQPHATGDTRVWVLPNPSRLNAP